MPLRNVPRLPTLQKNTVRKTTGFNTTSTSFVNVTDLVITFTTGARRVLLTASYRINNASTDLSATTFTVDGTNVGDATLGLATHETPTAVINQTITFVTDVLTAASHTFRVQLVNINTGTFNVTIEGTPTCVFSAIELL